MYTIVGKQGERDLSIERSLSKVEGQFATVRRTKLDKHLPLDLGEKITVCVFAAAMFARTKTYREHLRSTWSKALELIEKVQEAHEKASPEQREQMQSALGPVGTPEERNSVISKEEVEELVASPLQNTLSAMVEAIAPNLIEMPWVVMVAPRGSAFVTSDTPCVWFDKGEYETPKTRYAGRLMSPSLEITMPLSPWQMLVFSNKLSFTGYWTGLRRQDAEALNHRTLARAGEFVVRNSRYV